MKLDNWTWYATGPVNGIQLKRGKNKGRLIIPCDHIEAFNKRYYSHVIFSDDGGLNWKLGGSTLEDDVNECTVVELHNGKISASNKVGQKGELIEIIFPKFNHYLLIKFYKVAKRPSS